MSISVHFETYSQRKPIHWDRFESLARDISDLWQVKHKLPQHQKRGEFVRRSSNRLGGTRVSEEGQEIRRKNKANKEESPPFLNVHHLSFLDPRSRSCCLIVQDNTQK
jgi:hypothetical protein